MRKQSSVGIALTCIVPGVALIAGCTAGSSQAYTPALPVTGAQSLGPSWMSAGAKSKDLVYVSNYRTNMVTVYSYDGGKGKSSLVGKLTNFYDPQGECVNSKGDVWIVNTGSSQILEYAHGGTTPIATLQVSGYNPVACAIDPKTGNLAVSNVEASGGNPGSVAVFKGAKGNPTYYQYNSIYRYGFCGYDDHSNLYVDGLSYSSGVYFAELAKGSSTMTALTLDQSINDPGAIVWDGKHIAIGDPATGTIYQFTIGKGVGKMTGSTVLNGTQEVVGFSIQGNVLIAPDFIYSRLFYFKYPQGGNSFGQVLYYISAPDAAVVSKAS